MKTVNQPKQARSRETYKRILDAAQEVMLEKNFESVSIQEIAIKAGFTTGAFYARFPNKGTLLIALTERLNALVSALFDQLEEWSQDGRSLEELTKRFINELAAFNEKHKGMLRSIRRTANMHPELQAKTAKLNRQLKDRLRKLFAPKLEEVAHPGKGVALNMALTIIFSTLRMHYVEDDLFPKDFQMPRKILIRELTTSTIRYLKNGE